jgi:shikimate kinase / 3-dehydroquinate synthase
VRLGLCGAEQAERVAAHLAAVGLDADLRALNRVLSAERLVQHMRRDKKTRDGELTFVLVRGIGRAFTHRDVPPDAVAELLRAEGCAP